MPRRVLLLNTDLTGGGAERQLMNLLQNLDRSRWAVTCLLLDGTGPFLQDVPEDVSLVIFSRGRPKSWWRKLIWGVQQLWNVRRFLRNQPFDAVVTVLWFPTLVCALSLARVRRKPKLVWSVQSDLDRSLRPFARLLLRKALRGRVAHFIATSAGIASSIKKSFSLVDNVVSLIPNAIDFDMVCSLSHEDGVEPKPEDRLRIVAMGRLVPVKGYRDLIAAVSQASPGLPQDYEVIILGDGPEREGLEKQVRESQLEGRIKFAGFVRNPYKWLRSADIFVLSSHWETFGIGIAEAMALGLPVVATLTDGAKDIVESGVHGLLVPVGDVDALSQAILKLATSPEVREGMGRKAREKARHFDVSALVPKYEEVLSKAMP